MPTDNPDDKPPDIHPGDIVTIVAFDDVLEHDFEIDEIHEDFVTGIALTGPLADFYGEPPIESEANECAANLLMPFDDLRRQIAARDKPDLEMLSDCAGRYEVSMQAAILRWLQYTTRRAVLVVARGGFILWARSSGPALKSGAFFRTANAAPAEIPEQSLAARRVSVDGSKSNADFDTGVWFREPCEEMVLYSGRYDFSMSLLHLGPAPSRFEVLDEEGKEDTFDSMKSRTPGSSWLG